MVSLDFLNVHADCTFRIQEDCKTKFDNVSNFNGEPFLPGPDEALQFPKAR